MEMPINLMDLILLTYDQHTQVGRDPSIGTPDVLKEMTIDSRTVDASREVH